MCVKDTGTQCRQHARADVVTQRDGSHEMRAGDVEIFAKSKRGRHHIAAWMPSGRPGIIGLVCMSHNSVCHRRFNGTANNIGGRDSRDFLASVGARELNGGSSGREFSPGNHGRECIQNVMLGLLDYGFRKCAVASLAHVRAECGHHGTRRLTGNCSRFPKK
jgi:hypothetical protein